MTAITNTDTVRSVTIDPELEKKLKRVATKAIESRAERDELIREAYRKGAGVREIARLVQLSHPGVLRILRIVKEPHHGSGGEIVHPERPDEDV